jgi:hypothetical protein
MVEGVTMFCPQCHAEYRPGFSVCGRCGVPLIEELPRPATAPTPETPETVGYDELVTVFSGSDPSTALLVRSLLEGAGIPCFSTGEGVQDLFGAGRLGLGYNPVVGSPDLRVHRQDEARARAALAALPLPPPSDAELDALAETAVTQPEVAPPRGIDGPLWGVAAVVVAFPLWIGYWLSDLLTGWSSKEWRQFTDPGGPMYHPLWVPYRWGSVGVEVVLMLWSLVLLYGLSHKRRWFPSLMVAFLATDLLAEAAYLVALWLTPVIGESMYAGDFRDFVLIAAIAVFVVPYLLLSERVRATFTQ